MQEIFVIFSCINRTHVYSEYNSWFHGVRFRHVFLYIHISFLLDSCCSIFNFLSNVLQITFCPFVLFLFAIVLSVVLQVTASVVSVVFTIFSQFYWWRKPYYPKTICCLRMSLYGSQTLLHRVWVMMFNATFNNISVISWRSVLNIGGGNRSTRRNPPTCRNSLKNVIT